MSRLDDLTDRLIEAKDPYLSISPGPTAVMKHVVMRRSYMAFKIAIKIVKSRKKNEEWRTIAMNSFSGPITGKLSAPFMRPIQTRVAQTYVWASYHSGPGLVIGAESKPDAKGEGRTWIDEPGRYKMVIVYHEANKAGPHIDVHIGHVSIIYKVKPDLYEQHKFNSDGSLTNASKAKIIEHVRSEVANGARTPQNLDHPDDQATYSWLTPEDGPDGYGSGLSRQVVSESEIDVYKAYQDGPIEFFAPAISPNHSLYLYQIYPGDEKRVPICIWGMKNHHAPQVEERLHLKMIDPADLDRYEEKMDMSTSTAKYDGSSVYLLIDKKGTTAWSPRISKKTGERIEYTPKINGLAAVGTNGTTDTSMVVMGELMFYREGKHGEKEFLDHATSGGILNSHDLLPEDVKPVVVVYRVDRVGRNKTVDMEFWEQRELANEIVSKNPEHLMLPELMSPQEAKAQGYEGVVVCRPGEGVTTAYKTKWWTDNSDWVVDSVDFVYSDKGNVSGVVRMTDLETGKHFNMGPGQMGDRAFCEHMMVNSEDYVGTVFKVRSRHGHVGRAAKVVEIHPDKGSAPPKYIKV